MSLFPRAKKQTLLKASLYYKYHCFQLDSLESNRILINYTHLIGVSKIFRFVFSVTKNV